MKLVRATFSCMVPLDDTTTTDALHYGSFGEARRESRKVAAACLPEQADADGFVTVTLHEVEIDLVKDNIIALLDGADYSERSQPMEKFSVRAMGKPQAPTGPEAPEEAEEAPEEAGPEEAEEGPEEAEEGPPTPSGRPAPNGAHHGPARGLPEAPEEAEEAPAAPPAKAKAPKAPAKAKATR